jgi:hypothetical protein
MGFKAHVVHALLAWFAVGGDASFGVVGQEDDVPGIDGPNIGVKRFDDCCQLLGSVNWSLVAALSP